MARTYTRETFMTGRLCIGVHTQAGRTVFSWKTPDETTALCVAFISIAESWLITTRTITVLIRTTRTNSNRTRCILPVVRSTPTWQLIWSNPKRWIYTTKISTGIRVYTWLPSLASLAYAGWSWSKAANASWPLKTTPTWLHWTCLAATKRNYFRLILFFPNESLNLLFSLESHQTLRKWLSNEMTNLDDRMSNKYLYLDWLWCMLLPTIAYLMPIVINTMIFGSDVLTLYKGFIYFLSIAMLVFLSSAQTHRLKHVSG